MSPACLLSVRHQGTFLCAADMGRKNINKRYAGICYHNEALLKFINPLHPCEEFEDDKGGKESFIFEVMKFPTTNE